MRKLRVGQEELRGDQSQHEEPIQKLLEKAGVVVLLYSNDGVHVRAGYTGDALVVAPVRA